MIELSAPKVQKRVLRVFTVQFNPKLCDSDVLR